MALEVLYEKIAFWKTLAIGTLLILISVVVSLSLAEYNGVLTWN